MALGSTNLKKGDNIDALLGKSQSVPLPSQKGTDTTIRAAKLTDDEIEKIDLVKKMLGTDNASEALRWCIKAAWATHGNKIKEIVDKKESVSSFKDVFFSSLQPLTRWKSSLCQISFGGLTFPWMISA